MAIQNVKCTNKGATLIKRTRKDPQKKSSGKAAKAAALPEIELVITPVRSILLPRPGLWTRQAVPGGG